MSSSATAAFPRRTLARRRGQREAKGIGLVGEAISAQRSNPGQCQRDATPPRSRGASSVSSIRRRERPDVSTYTSRHVVRAPPRSREAHRTRPPQRRGRGPQSRPCPLRRSRRARTARAPTANRLRRARRQRRSRAGHPTGETASRRIRQLEVARVHRQSGAIASRRATRIRMRDQMCRLSQRAAAEVAHARSRERLRPARSTSQGTRSETSGRSR